jgi:hypothetical protein
MLSVKLMCSNSTDFANLLAAPNSGFPAVSRRVLLVVALPIASLVAWSLWQCQQKEWLNEEDIGLFYPPPVGNERSTHCGWPTAWVESREVRSQVGGGPQYVTRRFLPYGTAIDVLAWLLIIGGTSASACRLAAGRGRFSVRVALSAQLAVAIVLCWWRREYVSVSIVSEPALSGLLWDNPDTPMLRLLTFPWVVGIPVLVGILCTAFESVLLCSALVRLALKLGRSR